MQKPDRIKRDDICQTSQCTRFVTPEIAGNFECGCEIFMISCNQVVADLSLLMNNLKCVPHASGWLRYSATATHANTPKMTDYCHFSYHLHLSWRSTMQLFPFIIYCYHLCYKQCRNISLCCFCSAFCRA